MNWWGNSIDRAYGLSNIASSALKKAQKKIDKVLDIPSEDAFGIESAKPENPDKDLVESLSLNNNKPAGSNEFTEINLRSPEVSISDKNELNFANFEESVSGSHRLGDWSTEDSLTASQFQRHCDDMGHKTVPMEDTKIESLDPVEVNFQLNRDDNQIVEVTSVCTLDDSNSIPISDPVTIDKENPFSNINRFSHLSMSSDCTSSTVKKVNSDMESSGHTDDFTSLNNEMSKSDSSFFTEDQDQNDGSKSKMDQDTVIEVTPNIGVNHSISVNSAYKDDIDSNTTSSDIEPLSCATSTNDDSHLINNHTQPRYFIPDYMKHQRSASGSSLSICKIDNVDESNDSDPISLNQMYLKQIKEVTQKLDIRESKMIQLSRENMDLRDTVNNLTRQIEQMNERQETDTTDINALTREFTTRLSDAEKRYQVANKERDQLKKYVSDLKNIESQQIEKVIKEKEEQVASLLLEGEKLAQDQLKASNTIKKLRSNVKEKTNEINLTSQKLAKYEADIAHLKKVLDNNEENERKHIDGISQLTKAVEKLEKENAQLNNSKEILQDRTRSLEITLDKSSQELVKLRQKIIQLETEKVSIESNHKTLVDQQANRSDIIVEMKMKLEQSNSEINLLQKKIQNQAREFSYKEDEYNARITYLQDRVADMEQRQEELSEGASVATKPILRQLEALQNACAIQTANWERNETNLNMKLMDLQQKLTISEEATQTYKEQLQSRDCLANSLREEKNRLLSQYNQEYMNKQMIIDAKMILEQKVSELEQSIYKENENHNREIQNLKFKLADAQQKLELEKQNSNNLSAKLTSMQIMLDSKQEKRRSKSRNNSGASTTAEVEPDDSVSIVSNKSYDNTDKKANGTSSVYEQLRQQGVAVMMEYLEASLKQKEGQISKLHRELENMSRSRDSMIEEMTLLTQTIEKLEMKLQSQQGQMDNVSGLNDRYNALLQMYGEKLEECQELRMDITEMKEVYRSHIDVLSKSRDVL